MHHLVPSRLQILVQAEPSRDLSLQFENFACVALLLRRTDHDLELAFIRRAENPNDGWGGHLAFPGGRKDPEDLTDLDTALREVAEEVGLKLEPKDCLGRLHDVQARQQLGLQPFYLRPFVFFAEGSQTPKIKTDEVADFFWLPLGHLQDPKNRTHVEFVRDQNILKLPAIDVPKQPRLWGLSLMILEDLMARIKSGDKL
jgi:8-oxo-dGTP pyrophosphatase MutT (NUDIX family)